MKALGMLRCVVGLGLAGLLAGATAPAPFATPIDPPRTDVFGALLAKRADHTVVLADGQRLRLSADGMTLSLSDPKHPGLPQTWALPQARGGATLTVMPSGRVLIWGGANSHGALLREGLWFDQSVHALSEARGLALAPRLDHSATVLTDGRVLFAGGHAQGSTAELWDERTNAVTPLRVPVAMARMGHQASLQADGRVRMRDGIDVIGHPAAADVLFDATTFQFQTVARLTESVDPSVVALAGSAPEAGSQAVSPDARLALRFTQLLRSDDLNQASVTLLGPGGMTPVRVVPAEGGRLVFVKPVQELLPDSKYTLLVDRVRAMSGQPLPLVAVDFRTRVLVGAVPAQSPLLARDNAAGTAPARVTTGQQQTDDATCPQGRSDFALCRKHGLLDAGIWTPGQDNAHSHWRVAGAQPELLDAAPASWVFSQLHMTGVMGRVLRVDGVPVANAEVNIGSASVRTTANGDFVLIGVPAGHQEIYVDGTTANGQGAEYGQFVVGVNVKRDRLTQLPYTMYLPRIAERDKIQITSPLLKDLVVSQPDMPGLELHIPAGTVIRDRKGRLVTELAVVPTPVNRAPFPVMENHPMAFTIEPGGSQIRGITPQASGGIRVYYPNYDHRPAGTKANFWIYDPTQGWRVYGEGTVDAKGRQIVPEQGVALHQTMGGMFSIPGNNPAPDGDAPACHEGCGSAGTGSGATAGDPIDLLTGKFLYSDTDISIPDVMSIGLERHYRPDDIVNGEFGTGTVSNYNMYLRNHGSYDQIDMVLPNGGYIPFVRSAGTGAEGQWVQSGSPTSYSGAVLNSVHDSDPDLGVEARSYRVTLRDGSVLDFGTWNDNRLFIIKDRFGNRVTLTYDGGFLSRVSSPGGRFIKFTYGADNNVQSVTDSIGRVWGYQYTNNLLTKITYPDTTFKQITYKTVNFNYATCPPGMGQSQCDYFQYWQLQFGAGNPLLAHQIESIIDRRGKRILLNEFDSFGWVGRVIKQTLADNSFYAIEYEHYDATLQRNGRQITQPDGSKRFIVLDTTVPYPASDTIGYGTPLAQTFQFEHDGYGRTTARIDPLGRRTEYQYDGYGRTTGVIYLAGTSQAATASAQFNDAGDLISITDPLNHTTTFGYANRCLTSVTSPLGKVTTVTCNQYGQPTSVTDPLHHTPTTLQYFGFDLASVTDPLGRTVSVRRDLLGRPVAVQDTQGNVSRREYDVNGRVSKAYDAAGNPTTIGYDPNGNVLAVLKSNQAGITYDYDDRGWLKTRTDSLAHAEAWTYDGLGRVKTATDRNNQQTTFDYDVLGRPTVIHYADTSTKTFAYADNVHLSSVTDSTAGMVSWTYDDFDRRKSEAGAQGTVEWGYDAAGRRTSMNAGTQTPIAYSYDDGNRLTAITQGAETVGFNYDDDNRLTQTTLPNGVQAGYAYNDANQLTGIAWLKADHSALGDLGYGYDSVGRLVAQTGSFASQTLPLASTGTNTFDDNHRQTVFNGQALAYDTNGNLTGDGTNTYIWNARNQLIQIKQGSTVIASFTYDALGRRSTRAEGGSTTSYLYDGLNPVQETKGGTVNPILTGLGVDQRFARDEAGGRTYFLTDMLGSTRGLTNAAGVVVNRYDYTAYGDTTQSAGGYSNPYQYTGREHDLSGLYYNRARYYNSSMERFISEDPIGLSGGLNTYAYVGGNPLSFVDLSGLVCVEPTQVVISGHVNHDIYETYTYQLEDAQGHAVTGAGYSVQETISPNYGSTTNNQYVPIGADGKIYDDVGFGHPQTHDVDVITTQTFDVMDPCGHNHHLTTVLQHENKYISNGNKYENTVTDITPAPPPQPLPQPPPQPALPR